MFAHSQRAETESAIGRSSTMPNQTARRILTINTGSSSLKVALYEAGREETRILSGEVERIGVPGGPIPPHRRPRRDLDRPGGRPSGSRCRAGGGAGGSATLPPGVEPRRGGAPGGSRWQPLQRAPAGHPRADRRPPRTDTDRARSPAPGRPGDPGRGQGLSGPPASGLLRHGVPPAHAPDRPDLPLPRRLADEGVVRYGFHGLSYESILRELRAVAPREAEGRVVIAHLGNGASMAAVRGGIGIDTTMGFTPAGGLMMGTRPGDLDPGVLLYLLIERGMTPAAVNELVNRQAGLLGVSGISADMRDLLEREAADRACRRGHRPVLLSGQEVSGCLGRRPGRPGHPGLYRRDRRARRLRPPANLRGSGVPRHPARSATATRRTPPSFRGKAARSPCASCGPMKT